MAKRFIEDDTLTAIADAIREKNGSTAAMYPKSMPSYIRSIQTAESATDYTDYPDYVVTEGKRVASSMLSKRGANSITAIFISDSHDLGDSDSTDSTIELTRFSNKCAGQGARVIADNIDVDFVAHLGDFCYGAKTGKMSDFVQGIANAKGYLHDVAKDHETFYTPGNHDTATYGYEQNGDYLSQGALDALIGTYRYVDFTAKKVRVICLNTAEVDGLTVSGATGTHRMTGAQLQWFADSLDLSGKSDAASWGIVIMSHAPLDWDANILPAANCLQAYLTGASFSVTHNGVAVSKNFSGKNAAKVICQFHGHVHGFRVDNIHYGTSGSLTASTVKRIAIPNSYMYRNNEYGENGALDSNNLEFGETTTYAKTAGTAKNTAFCLVSIDLDNEVIYADCYGAGYDRVISYAEEVIVTYSVTNNLSNASTSNGTATVTEGSSYSAAITANSGYDLSGITVTMGGTDITATAVSGSNITIANVTGDIVITVTTVAAVVPPSYTNLVPTSIDTDGSIYNGTGYKEGYRLNSSGVPAELAGAVHSGFIPYDGEVIRMWGTTSANSSNSGNYIGLYDANFAKIYVLSSGNAVSYGGTWEAKDGKYMLTLDPETCTNTATKNYLASAKYIRVSWAVGTGANLVVTLDEPIE